MPATGFMNDCPTPNLARHKPLNIKQHYTQLVNWFRQAAERGNTYAQHSLGIIYEHGWGVEQNCAKAVAATKLPTA